MSDPELILHATCVAHAGRGVLITGTSGAGKSGLALDLMALGAGLVSDDRVKLHAEGNAVMASAPKSIEGRIEARFVGILNAVPVGPTRLCLIVDLDHDEVDRLPPWRVKNLLGVSVPLLHNSASRYFPAAILQYLRAGRSD